MADSKLTDQLVADLVAVLRSDASLDAKVAQVNTVKSGIKQHNVPEAAVADLFEALRAASTSQHASLVNAGFTALNHLLTRLSRQDSRLLAKEAARTLPLVADRLGDHKDKLRSLASQALTTFFSAAPADVERVVRNQAMTGKNARAKDAAMHWLLQMHKDHNLQFRSYVPVLMELLEDADGTVRDAAKGTVIELFKTAPNAAKSDLKRQLKNFNVRSAIQQAIVKALAPTSARPDTPSDAGRPNLAASVSSLSGERPMTPAADAQAEPIEPMYVNTGRELDDLFRDMAWHFDGRETEQNWIKREQAIGTLRKLNAGNTPADFHDAFLAHLRSMLDGIIKAMNSLRTSLCKEGCGLIQEIAVTFGPAMDNMVELLMQTLVKLSAGTKKISSQQANVTVDTIVGRATYTLRLMQHVWGACQDKNVQPRMYATGWLKTLIKKEAHHKNMVEHTGGVDLMEKCIKKCLGDANPGVREKMRSTYWAFWAVWPARADAIMADLEPTAQKLLNKDPSNPNSSKHAVEPTRPGAGAGHSSKAAASTSSKPSLREAMMAQRKAAMATRNLPQRPGSAMAQLTPARPPTTKQQQSSSTTTTTTHAAAPSTTTKPAGHRTRQEPTVSVNAGGMSVAPMRPSRRRPDLAQPATAGPYSVRDQPASVEANSPDTTSFKKPLAVRTKEPSSPKRTTARARPGHSTHASESGPMSPAARAASRIASPLGSPTSPTSPKMSRRLATSPSPSKSHEDMTLVVPTMPSIESALSPSSPARSESVTDPAATELPSDSTTKQPSQQSPSKESATEASAASVLTSPTATMPEIRLPESESSPSDLKVYEDPVNPEPHRTPSPPRSTTAILEEKPVNEDAAQRQPVNGHGAAADHSGLPEKTRQNSRLVDSGIAKIEAKALEVHGFRKLQSLIRDGRTVLADDRFEALLLGLFRYLETPPGEGGAADKAQDVKAQDVKAQILTTIKLLLKRERANFQPFVSRGLEALLQTRGNYDARAHVIGGLELLADELVALGDGPEMLVVLTARLGDVTDATPEGCRTLSMGLHVLRELLDGRAGPVPMATPLSQSESEAELANLTRLAGRALASTDSGVRMDAVKLCVSLHQRVGEEAFWAGMSGVADEPKSLITYYIVKRQREGQVV